MLVIKFLQLLLFPLRYAKEVDGTVVEVDEVAGVTKHDLNIFSQLMIIRIEKGHEL